MPRIAFFPVLALLAAGCASRGTLPPTSASAAPAQPASASAHPTQPVELRHFYLLSPGPSSTLVVTRSDTAPTPR